MPRLAIEFREVTYSRPRHGTVLARLSFAIEAGEVLALVGRSGAGKTTILKLVNRLLVADAGSVLVDQRDTREWDPIQLRRRVGYVLQDVGLFPHLTIGANIGIVPRLERWPDTRVAARTTELLDLVGLPAQDFAMRWPD